VATHKSKEIWLLRHSETEWSLSGQHTGNTDIELTPKGIRDAERLRPVVDGHPFSLVLSSPLRRAYDTCRIMGLAGQAVVTDDLREWDYGIYEGRTTADIQRDIPGWSVWTNTIHGGETTEEVGLRCQRVIERALAADGDVALFGHGHCLRILAACWLGLSPRQGRLFALSTGTVSVLGFEHNRPVFRHWNARSLD
jgi:probable phosphoglycerate mutase